MCHLVYRNLVSLTHPLHHAAECPLMPRNHNRSYWVRQHRHILPATASSFRLRTQTHKSLGDQSLSVCYTHITTDEDLAMACVAMGTAEAEEVEGHEAGEVAEGAVAAYSSLTRKNSAHLSGRSQVGLAVKSLPMASTTPCTIALRKKHHRMEHREARLMVQVCPENLKASSQLHL